MSFGGVGRPAPSQFAGLAGGADLRQVGLQETSADPGKLSLIGQVAKSRPGRAISLVTVKLGRLCGEAGSG